MLKNLKLFFWGLCAAIAMVCGPLFAQTPTLSPQQAASILKTGGVALVLRHGQTEAGVGDPPQFVLGTCSTQRNLSDSGREALREMAERNTAAGIRFSSVFTSQWCRTRETAQILGQSLGQDLAVQDWVVLNSQFADNPKIADANAQITQKLRTMPAQQNWLLVTHQVNIAALTGEYLASAEGLLLRMKRGKLEILGRVAL